MKKFVILVCLVLSGLLLLELRPDPVPAQLQESAPQTYWLLLHRKSNTEFLYRGVPGDADQSTLQKTFTVKTGIPGKRPTPLPALAGREYWLITGKTDSSENPETAPYFLTLDIPFTDSWPYGPVPYTECGGQCDWVLPGSFGLHGINGDETRVSVENSGSSGCIRHRDDDISFLFEALSQETLPVRYYIEDI